MLYLLAACVWERHLQESYDLWPFKLYQNVNFVNLQGFVALTEPKKFLTEVSHPYFTLFRYVSKNFKLVQRSQIVDQKKEKIFCFKMSLILLQCDLYIKSCDKFWLLRNA